MMQETVPIVLYIGSVYCDPPLWKSGMIGEGVKDRSVLVVKTHTLSVSTYVK